MGELCGELLQAIVQRHPAQELIAPASAFVRPSIDDDAAAASLVADVARRRADHERVEGCAAVAQWFEHLIVLTIAELASFRDDRHDDGTARLTLLEAFGHFDQRIEQI